MQKYEVREVSAVDSFWLDDKGLLYNSANTLDM